MHLIKEKFLKLNIDEHVKQIIHTSQKKSHDTLDKKNSQTNTLINNLQLDFKKTRDLLTELKNETKDFQNVFNNQKCLNTQQTMTIDESRNV